MAKLVVLSGVPGSGKSYFSHILRDVKKSHVYIISSDALRDLVTGNRQDFSHEELMWKFFYDLAKVYSKDPEGIVVLDATNTSAYYRIESTKPLNDMFDETILVCFNIKPDIVYRQNLDREWPIPTAMLTEFIAKFELPGEKEYDYFDRVYVIEGKDFLETANQI